MNLDCMIEKVILAYTTLKTEGIARDLLEKMMENKVPGFCVEVLQALEILGLKEDSEALINERRS